MAKMREKNEAIRKRYNEVQEDLKNAQAISSQVKVELSGSEDEDKKPVHKVVNKTPPRDRESRKKFTPTRRQNSESSDQQGGGGAEQAAAQRPIHAFEEGAGPPPDPGYNFLADEERDGPRDNKEQKDKAQNKNNSTFSGRGGSFRQRGPRNSRQRGGQRGGRQFSNEDFGRPSRDGAVPDKDQKWREERAAIDEARMKRGVNSEGNWRREWDNEKGEDQPQQPNSSNRGGGRGRGSEGRGGGYRGQNHQQRGNGTKFFYQRGRGNYHPQGENNFQNDKWVREAPPAFQGSSDGPPVKDLRDIINSKRGGSNPGAGRSIGSGFGEPRFDSKPRREPIFRGSNKKEHADHNDDEWEDVE